MKLAILGRQPELSLAELVRLFGKDVSLLTRSIAKIEREDISLARLGGTQKIVNFIDSAEGDVSSVLDKLFVQLLEKLPDGKIAVGISIYGKKTSDKELFACGLSLKKQLRQTGRSVRILPTKNGEVSAAQIIHNDMTGQGADIVLAYVGTTAYAGITEQVQDIESYTKRDYGRPARDARVGMLPPKLAQIMINLANPKPGSVVLDPFCGTGVVLQEAALMGYEAYGTDIEPTLITMSQTNLDYLDLSARLEVGDARTHQWQGPIGAVVTEGYLGEPQTHSPQPAKLAELKSDATKLTLDFLRNLHGQIEPGTPVCMTLPAWHTGKGFERLDILDQIRALGYTVLVFSPPAQEDLLYARDDQIVGRQIITLRRA